MHLMNALRLATAAALTLALTVPVWAGPPTEEVRQYTEQVRRILEDPALKGEDKQYERRAAVRKVAIQVFDVEETAKRALGRHWRERTPAERTEFVELFADLLERTYISKIDLYGGEQIRYLSELVDGDTATVRAKIITKRGTEVPVDARMLHKGERWFIYDISLENVSLIGNYRAQFDQIVRTASYKELVRRLKDKGGSLNTDAARGSRTRQ